jgi:hypothetical protein
MLDYDDLDTHQLQYEVCKPYSVDPDIPDESEQFFRHLLRQYNGPNDRNSVRSWLENQVRQNFIAIGQRPQWIQTAEWQFDEYGRPMIFAGQTDLVKSEFDKVLPDFYHDDTSLYVFVGKKVLPRVVLQQY